MFGRGFALEILKPTTAGNPSVVARPVLWSAGVVLVHPQFWNTVFALTQLLLALGLFWRRSVKPALAGTVAWSLIVWWLGEGLGGLLAGSATPLMGAPGAVSLYALVALLLWPRDGSAGRSTAETSILRRAAPLAWLLVWAGEAYLALLPANDSPAALHAMLAGMADGEPRQLAALDRLLGRLVAHHSAVGPVFGALFALCALAVFVPRRLAKPLYALAMVLAAITWVGQDFGGILTGHGTDPNSGPLLCLLALAYWPIAPAAAREPGGANRRPPLLRLGIAIGAAVLVGTSSVAAATGLTAASAKAHAKGELTLTSEPMLGPGRIRTLYTLAGYRILFRDPGNRATRPGIVSIELSRRGRSLNGAHITLEYRSLDMPMPTRTLTFLGRGNGLYTQESPLLGMGGCWRITVAVVPHDGPALLLVLKDLIARRHLAPAKLRFLELMTTCHG
jgi:hypothetical protein